MLAVDARGVLQISSASDLRKQLRSLARTLGALYGGSKVMSRHTFSTSMAYTGVFRDVGLSELRVCFKVFNTEEEVRYNERMALLKCSRKYGEPPPFNLGLGREIVGIMNTSIASKTHVHYGLDKDLKEMLGV